MSRHKQAAERAAIAFLLGERKLTIAEAASRLGKTERHVRRLLQSGVIPGKKIQDGRAVRKSWRVSSLDLPVSPSDWLSVAEDAIAYHEPWGENDYERFISIVWPEVLRSKYWRRYKVLREPIQKQTFAGMLQSVERETFADLHRFPWPIDGYRPETTGFIQEHAPQLPKHPPQIWADKDRVHWLRASRTEPALRIPEITPWTIEPKAPERPPELPNKLTPDQVQRHLTPEAQAARAEYRADTDEQLRQLFALTPWRSSPLPRRPSSGWSDLTAY